MIVMIDEIITAGSDEEFFYSNTDDSSDDKPGLFYSCLESFLSVTKLF